MKTPLTMGAEREARYRGLADAPEWTEWYVVLRELLAELDATRAAHAATQAVARELAAAIGKLLTAKRLEYRAPEDVEFVANAIAIYNAHKAGVLANDPEVKP